MFGVLDLESPEEFKEKCFGFGFEFSMCWTWRLDFGGFEILKCCRLAFEGSVLNKHKTDLDSTDLNLKGI